MSEEEGGNGDKRPTSNPEPKQGGWSKPETTAWGTTVDSPPSEYTLLEAMEAAETSGDHERVIELTDRVLALPYEDCNAAARLARGRAMIALGHSWAGFVELAMGVAIVRQRSLQEREDEREDERDDALDRIDDERDDEVLDRIEDEADDEGNDDALDRIDDVHSPQLDELDREIAAVALEGAPTAATLDRLEPVYYLYPACARWVLERCAARCDSVEVAWWLSLAAHESFQSARALDAARVVAKDQPDCLQAKAMIARTLEDGPEAIDAVRDVLAALDGPCSAFEDWARGLASIRVGTEIEPKRLRRRLLQMLQDAGRDDELIAVARESVEHAPDSTLAWLDYGMIMTGLERHADAVDAYTKAIDLFVAETDSVYVGTQPDVMWFNRACERCKTGDLEGALQDLAEAIRRDPQFLEDAQTDDYLDPLRDDVRFARLLANDFSDFPVQQTPTPEIKRGPPSRWDALYALREDNNDIEIGELLRAVLRKEAVPHSLAILDEFARVAREPGAMIQLMMSVALMIAGQRTLEEMVEDLRVFAEE